MSASTPAVSNNKPQNNRGSRAITAFAALSAGCFVNYLGDHLLGVRVELWHGLDTFSFLWFLDIFIVPAIAGIVVSLIFGLGGKWLCYFPPLIVRLIAYFEAFYLMDIPEGASLMPMGLWGFFVILAIESAAVGGVLGEIMRKRTYGRSPGGIFYKSSRDDIATTDSEE